MSARLACQASAGGSGRLSRWRSSSASGRCSAILRLRVLRWMPSTSAALREVAVGLVEHPAMKRRSNSRWRSSKRMPFVDHFVDQPFERSRISRSPPRGGSGRARSAAETLRGISRACSATTSSGSDGHRRLLVPADRLRGSRARTACRSSAAARPARTGPRGQKRDESGVSTSSISMQLGRSSRAGRTRTSCRRG